MEYDGVVVEDTSDLQRKAWLRTAEEEGRPAPPQFALRRSEGMKNDQVAVMLSNRCINVQLHGNVYACHAFQ